MRGKTLFFLAGLLIGAYLLIGYLLFDQMANSSISQMIARLQDIFSQMFFTMVGL